jgi:(p)ppGpp synthase/HD superfamily hydrolase
LNLIKKAIEFATMAHDKQYRKIVRIPYISHPYTVGMMLLQVGCQEETVAAGILHDVIEDTDVTIEDLEQEFGFLVAQIVAGCTEPEKSRPWEERKSHTIAFLKSAPIEVKMVACADKIDNLSSIIAEHARVGEKVWDSFKRGREKQEWYYRSMAESILDGVTEAQKKTFFVL